MIFSFFSYVVSGKQEKNILFLKFRHLSLSSIIPYIATFKKKNYFYEITVKFTKLKLMPWGNKLVYEEIETVYKPLKQSTT